MARSNTPRIFLLDSRHLMRKYSSSVKPTDTKYDIPPFESDSPCKDRKIKPASEEIFKPIAKTELNIKGDLEVEKVNKKCGHIGEISIHNDEFRCNDLNIQMLSRSIFKQLFNNTNPDSKPPINLALNELKKHGLPGPLSKVPDVDLKLPPLIGENIEEHFYAIGEEQCSPYRSLVFELLNDLPPIPKEWEFNTGWMKYECNNPPVSVEYPDEDALLFDVEVCRSHSEMPTIATAASKNAWYSWVSKDLFEDNSKVGNLHYVTDDLIPMQPKKGEGFTKPRVIVGHAVSYDRARIREQYLLDRSGTRFVDTMSLHISISGITSYQKSVLKTKSEDRVDDEWCKYTSLNSLSEVHNLYCGSPLPKEEREVFVEGSLKEVKEKFQSLMTYCATDVIATHKILKHLWPSFLERFPHPVTLAGMLELSTCYLPVNDNWKRFTEHCKQSYDDLDIESKLILSQQADKACQLLHEDKYKEDLWLWDRDWNVKHIKLKKIKMTKKSIKEKLEREEMEKNAQNELTVEDENIFDNHEKLHNKFAPLIATSERLPKRIPYLAGYPEWYRKLCLPPSSENWRPGPQLISTSMQVAPKLLSLMWKSMPLHYIRGKGWGQLVPHQTSDPLPEDEMSLVPLKKLKELYFEHNSSRLKLEANVTLDESSLHDKVQLNVSCAMKKKRGNRDYLYRTDKVDLGTANFGVTCGILRLPHKDGDHLNVGNPLSRDFINKFSDAGLSGNNEKTERVIEISRMLSYWKNNRERIENQLVVWLSNNELPRSINSENGYGAILPQVAVCGTLTRRAVERTWMTASNATDERVGSELRSMIQAPEGYSIVGADVDSQELWIASLIGDAHFTKDHGCTAFGWMTLSGQKSDGTDMHSMTAKTMGISRSHAKIINYARIYGAGQPFAQRLLKQFIPEISAHEARQKAFKMFESTKGRRVYRLKPNALPQTEEREYEKGKVKQICEIYGKSVDELFENPKWKGGSESAMFNRLEEIAYSSEPATPFLQGRLSRALESSVHECDSKLVPTRINWVVQSGAVDFLHLMLVCMKWLIHPQVRFSISFHDEVRYLSPDKYKYQTALALHVTNLLTRTFCVRRLGMIDLPQSVAFFTSVEVDTVLRKEANNDCITPSNPHGLSKGYGIRLGESLDITNAISKADGVIGYRKVTKKCKEKENVNKFKKEICDE